MISFKRLSTCVCALAFLAAGVAAWGQTTPPPQAQVVYVVTGGSQVYAVTTDATATTTSLIPTDHVNTSAEFTSLTVGPDNTSGNTDNTDFFLYACDTGTGAVVRLTMSTSSPDSAASAVGTVTTGVAQPVCGRVDSAGDLYVSSASSGSGVYVIRGVSTASSLPIASAPTEVYSIGGSFTGGGITQKNNGDMLIVDSADGTILHAPFIGSNFVPAPAPDTRPFGALDSSAYVSDLSSPSAIARISTNDFFVANQGNGTVERFTPGPTGPTSSTTCSISVPHNGMLSSLAASQDNYVYVGIASSSPQGQAVLVLNGKAANCGGVASISLSNLPSKQSAKTVAAVAVPPVPLEVTPTSKTDPTTGDTLWTFNFGNSEVQTLTGGCTLEIQEGQVSVPSLASLLNGVSGTAPDGTTNFSDGKPVPFNGEGGFGTTYTVVNASSCQPIDTYNSFVLGAFDDTTQFTNSRIIHCDGSTCDVPDTSGFWPIGGLIPGDITTGVNITRYSKFFLANGQQETTSETGIFCGFGSPLNDAAPYSTFNSGQNLSVKFEVADEGADGTCSNGPFITDAVALLSVEQVPSSPTAPITPVTIDSSGNSTAVSPIITYSPSNKQYQFSLSLKGYAPGRYALVVTFLSNTTVADAAAPNGGATYVVTYFNVQ